MGPKGRHQTDLERQGSGARRTLLWTALKILSDIKPIAKAGATARPNVLLLDEPEICLHPNAIREACRVLYALPATGTWQVMVTTHLPLLHRLFAQQHTVVCVERDEATIKTTTCYRPKKGSLSEDDVKLLKLLNMCDPYVAEFFFGGRTVVVEGDTEYTAFKYVTGIAPALYRDVPIIRARGKATICSVAKILNQFGARYSILHDSDKPTCQARKSKKSIKNPAWGNN